MLSRIDLNVTAGEFVLPARANAGCCNPRWSAIAGFSPSNGQIRVADRPVSGPGVDSGVVFRRRKRCFRGGSPCARIGVRASGCAEWPRPQAGERRRALSVAGRLSQAAEKKNFRDTVRRYESSTRVPACWSTSPSVVRMDETVGASRRPVTSDGAAARTRSHLARDRPAPSFRDAVYGNRFVEGDFSHRYDDAGRARPSRPSRR